MKNPEIERLSKIFKKFGVSVVEAEHNALKALVSPQDLRKFQKSMPSLQQFMSQIPKPTVMDRFKAAWRAFWEY